MAVSAANSFEKASATAKMDQKPRPVKKRVVWPSENCYIGLAEKF